MIMVPRERVRTLLASHLGTDEDVLVAGARLEADLGLDPLDLVLIVLRLEEATGAELPIAELEGVVTLGELEALVDRWTGDVHDRETLPSAEPRTASGTRPAIAAASPRSAAR